MFRLVLANLRRNAGRALAMMLTILFATSGFIILTASTARSQLTVTGQVDAHFRGSYDILVRPSGSRTAMERDRGLLRPNFLAGQYGGITGEQWRQVSQIPEVDVAAPVASLGYAPFFSLHAFDLTSAVDRTATRQVVRRRQVWHADRGLTTAMDSPSLIYLTVRPVIRPADAEPVDGMKPYDDGQRRANPCGAGSPWPTWEVQEDGRVLPICLSQRPRSPARDTPALVARLRQDGQFEYPTFSGTQVSDRLAPPVLVGASFLVQAVDPASEARLTGLDRAIVEGRYLEPEEPGLAATLARPISLVPALGTTSPAVDESVSVRAERIVLAGSGVAGLPPGQAGDVVSAAPVDLTRDTPALTAGQIAKGTQPGAPLSFSGTLLQELGRPRAVDYDVGADQTLHPRPAPPAASAWADPARPAPMLWTDNAVRQTAGARIDPGRLSEVEAIGLDPVGFYDPARLTRFDPLAKTPLDTYEVERIVGADAESRAQLGDRTLEPNSNPGGYHSPPPTFLISLNWLTALTGEPAPISAVRVRVVGITGFNKLSRERVRLVAQRIAETTGLDVEITMGASPSAQTVLLPAGAYGRPALRLSEDWTRKGVAAVIVSAADRKSVVLFGLILVVCVLVLVNAVSAAVRHRATGLGVLSCLGWPRWRVAAVIAGEVAVLGLLAGMLGVLIAVPVSRALGTPVGWLQALWAIPVALALAVAAGVLPAWRGTRPGPLAVIRDTPSNADRSGVPVLPTVLGISVANLSRRPGRTALGVVALAVGVAGLTMLIAVTWVFQGTVTGSLLGEAVSVQVRGVDVFAVAAVVVLGLVSIVDVQYLNVRERAAELAALRAMAWSKAALGRLVAYEGAVAGFLGALLGAAAGMGATAWLAGAIPGALVLVAAIAAAVGATLAVAAAVVPALLMDRISLTAQLAEE